jgi:hypothetical protein
MFRFHTQFTTIDKIKAHGNIEDSKYTNKLEKQRNDLLHTKMPTQL